MKLVIEATRGLGNTATQAHEDLFARRDEAKGALEEVTGPDLRRYMQVRLRHDLRVLFWARVSAVAVVATLALVVLTTFHVIG